MGMHLILLSLAVATAALSAVLPQYRLLATESMCTDLVIPVTATANNTLMPAYPNSTSPTAFYDYLKSLAGANIQPNMHTVSGTWNISARFCEPTFQVQGREESIQVFVHGLTGNKFYWSGLEFPSPSFPDEYSWVSHAHSQGYATLAFDNLGNSNSSHPDPLQIVQPPLDIEITRNIIHGLRKSSLPSITHAYKTVILVAHSYGSILGRNLATLHPDDGADAYVLAGTSNNLTGLADLAAVWQIQAGKGETLPPGCLAPSSQGWRVSTYSFGSDFSPNMLAWDLSQPHNFAIGEFTTTAAMNDAASNFTGPVLVINGRYDQIVCGVSNITAEAVDCGVGPTSLPAQTKVLFPEARFQSYEVDHAGHNLNVHYSASETFGVAHEWLTNEGF